jgi:predicted ATPase
MYLDAIYRRPVVIDEAQFPWTLPLLRGLDRLEFSAPVTFLVGENGSGKSTLLEGLAAAMRAVAMGGHEIDRDPTLAAARAFAAGVRCTRRHHPRTKMFLRAEDIFGYTQRLVREMAELPAGEAAKLAARYGEDPDARSHGETFLALLETRLVPNGLYFLDEPETPLSPTRVIALLGLIREKVASGCQFIIATHSPILLALPDAEILSIEDGMIRRAVWDELEHVRVTRAFLNNPERILKQL